MTYAEMFLLLWAVVATFIAAHCVGRIDKLRHLLYEMSVVTRTLVFDDGHRDAARRLYESLGATRQLDKG